MLFSGAGLGFWGAGVCHRIVRRTFLRAGNAMPLCARCSGIYLGYLTTTVVVFLRGRHRPNLLAPPAILAVLLLFLGLVGLDGINSYLELVPILPNLYEPHNTLRLLTGSLEGVSLAGIFVPILHMTLWASAPEVRVLPNWRELGLVLLAVGGIDLLALWHPAALFVPLSLVSLLGLWLALAMVNTLLVAAVLRRAGRVSTWNQVITLLLWGGLLALAEMAALSWARYTLLGAYDLSL